MIELFDFQQRAVAQIADRFGQYWADRPWHGPRSTGGYVPFYQALASITASGKTAMMAATVTEIAPLLPLKPVVVWLSKGRVVVDQTFANLRDGGKYRHLVGDFEVRLLAEFTAKDCDESSSGLLYVATVGTFNQKDKEKGDRRLFQSDIDFADKSTWDAIKQRTTDRLRRPLIVVYDEAHNLTDQQTNLLMELEPDALILASATPKLPRAIHKIVSDLKSDLGWDDDLLTTYVHSKDVVDAGLVKRRVLLGGYKQDVVATIDDLLADLAEAERSVERLRLTLTPKAIYVCRTNVVEDNALQIDDPKRPFEQREAPPIRIWTYLVDEKGVDPATIAVYTSALKFDKAHPPPGDFVHFKGGDADYANFVAGNYRHIIFNLGLQEGWDDPECYFAYIDKSMGSSIQIEQVMGRALRQPGAKHYSDPVLNTAHFYVRVDEEGVFKGVVDEVRARLAGDVPDVEFASYDAGKRERPTVYSPKSPKTVPAVYLDAQDARDPVAGVLEALIDFRFDTGDNVKGRGRKAVVQHQVGSDDHPEFEWVERETSNTVSARWIFQTAVKRQFYRALEVTASDDPKLDARVQLGSPAHAVVRAAADEVVRRYLKHVRLKQRLHNPYAVGDVTVVASKARPYRHALHERYSGLNPGEREFAEELDKTKHVWCRNLPRTGFGIPLLTPGGSKVFYPDFLVWKGEDVFALDPTGEHILVEKLGRKLLDVPPHPKSTGRLWVRLISRGAWNDQPQRVGKEGWTVWRLAAGHELDPVTCGTVKEAVHLSLMPS